MSVLKAIVRLLWYRDSQAAVCLCIDLAWWMDRKDLKDMADYFIAVRDSKTKEITARQPGYEVS
jgi:hypothetical protein